MRTIIICTENLLSIPPFKDVTSYSQKILRNSYKELILAGREEGVEFVLSSFSEYENWNFKKGVTYNSWWKFVSSVQFDYIWDKTKLTEESKKFKELFSKKNCILNPFALDLLGSNKQLTNERFGKYIPQTFSVTKENLSKYLQKIRTRKAVIKPIAETGAVGVNIEDREKLEGFSFKGTYLLQEYAESKKDFFPFPYEVFDLRVVMGNGEFIDAYYRVSKPGVFTSNLSTGARTIPEDINKIPSDVKELAITIDNSLKEFTPRLYALDFIISPQGPFLIEITTKFGFMQYVVERPRKNKIINKRLVDFFKNLNAYK